MTTEDLTDPGKPNLHVSLGEDNMIHLVLGGNASEDYLEEVLAWAEKVKNAMRTAKANSKNGKVLTLIDISTLDQFDQKSMAILQDLMSFNKDYATKTATFGGNLFSIMAQETVMLMTHRTNMKAFKKREEALAWLKE
ncbi:MAG: hypothetical protein A2648_02090 [Candidatus Lloydbacteria bacterium RIFCSPHIGHO2_01_FULL_41_20]|uniref:STAS/SEC14 domain-containing protein n=1 Tax=Candidatus Lloydbacteria bacterium RIFCSPHIGHO2_01_FULL_41_20 TaxID=1798657 RepID=A0A1G2CQR7_9BACT|nr:MAG: hypothetical protein A2648_02090 [Candidatus Lloydbacteria bacterium RIFCSPHIGHO2_01_FULL_41_20]